MEKRNVKRIRVPLKIIVEYVPNDCYDDGDDWELGIVVNENNSAQCYITPFEKRLPDLTPKQLAEYIADAVREELWGE